jgi:hypothetical protein
LSFCCLVVSSFSLYRRCRRIHIRSLIGFVFVRYFVRDIVLAFVPFSFWSLSCSIYTFYRFLFQMINQLLF